MSAFSIPLSGLAATSSSLNVIANNLANLNTDGYKDQIAEFRAVYLTNCGDLGQRRPDSRWATVCRPTARSSNFSNGNINVTGISSEHGAAGQWILRGAGWNGRREYTRNGDFTVNSQGQLANPQGQLVMGYPATSTAWFQTELGSGAHRGQLGENHTRCGHHQFPDEHQSECERGSRNAPIARRSPYTIRSANLHVLTVNYTNTAANTWTYNISVPAADVGGTGNPVQVGTGTMTFNSSGDLTSPSGSVPASPSTDWPTGPRT